MLSDYCKLSPNASFEIVDAAGHDICRQAPESVLSAIKRMLDHMAMRSRSQTPEFSREPWYSDPGDHRCPHDAWLESVEISEPAAGLCSEAGHTTIKVKLLSAHHDGWITFTYEGVRSHSLTRYPCDQGMGDWLRDEFTVSEAGLVEHRITWHSATGSVSHWLIEAERITYAWEPKSDA